MAEPIIPLVRLEGVIAAQNLPGAGRALSLANVDHALRTAFSIKKAPAVALAVNSPGGSAAQSSLIGKRIRQLSEEKQKPALVFVEDIAASGGYWLACAGDEIFIDPSSILGSIGVISATFGLTDLIAKLGVERRVYTAGASKNQLDAFLPEKPDEVGRWKEKLAQIHEVFIAHVKARRGARLSTDPRLFTGEIFIGREALELGLADRFGDLHGVVRERFGRKAKVKPIPIGKPGLVSRLLGRAGTDAAEAALAAIDRRALWARYGL